MARHTWSSICRLPQTRQRARGQALVEFALIFPILLTVIFGIIEFSLILSSLGGFNFAVRDGARLGSLLGRSDPRADQEMVSTVSGHVLGLVMAKAQEVDIYRATADGHCLNQPTGGGASVAVDDPSCIRNRYNLDGSVYTGSSILWPVADRDDSLASADYLGVRVKFQYTWLTAFVAGSAPPLQLSATSVQRIEPLDFTGRAPRVAPVAFARPAIGTVIGTAIGTVIGTAIGTVIGTAIGTVIGTAIGHMAWLPPLLGALWRDAREERI